MQTVGAAQSDRTYAKALMRAFGGALLFSLPLMMTAEMWSLGGFEVDRLRLLIFLIVSLPVLLGLSYFVGFEATFRLHDEVLDALAAFGVGWVISGVLLALFGVITEDSTPSEAVGQVGVCAVPAAIGALLAGKQFGGEAPEQRARPGYFGVLFLMAVGAIFLALNIAPTDEIVLISHLMGPFRALALIAASLGLLHLFVYAVGFPGEDRRREAGGFGRTFLTFSIPGYALSLIVSAYCLWTFGRFDGVALHEQATMTVVLGFPAAIGAATSRLVT